MASTFSIYDAVALLAPDLQKRPREIFHFAHHFPAITPGSTQTGEIQISDDADFVAVTQQLIAYNTTGMVPVDDPTLLFMMRDTGSDRDLLSVPLPARTLFGTARQVFVLPQPKLIFRASSIALTVTNIGPTDTLRTYVVFSGFKLYGDPLK